MKRIYNPNKSRYKGIVSSATLKRKFILNLLIFTICIISIGYANLYTNLNIDGEINVKKPSCQVGNKLYNVLKCEAEENGLAREYTGSHQDSMDASLSTEKIYHWYGTTINEGVELRDKNNVIFANHCWQMIRTTDTGGVRMIYNGEAVNNQCLNTRNNHIGYGRHSDLNLASNYWYGTDYTYDSANNVFSISGTTEQATWNATTAPSLIGKYTCTKTTLTGTCSVLYLVDSYYDASRAYVISLNTSSNYSQFGTLQFNASGESVAHAGYMYNTEYKTWNPKKMTSTETMLTRWPLNTAYWYAHDIVWGSPTANKYNLNSPYRVSSTSDYPNLVGEYTLQSQTYTGNSAYYIAGVSRTDMFYIELTDSGNHTLADFNYTYTYGDSYTDNHDGTYTINYPTTINRADWFTEYKSVGAGKYVCKNATNNTCGELWYTTYTTYLRMDYLVVSNNYKYAKSFDYRLDPDDNTYKYFLDDATATSFWDITDSTNRTSLNNAHYTCFDDSGKCTTISYIFYLEENYTYYINLTNGKSVENALNEMLYDNSVNTTNSTIKNGVDAWYKKYLLEDYDSYIEDTIYCNDRSIREINGWNPDGGSITDPLRFKEYSVGTDLSCTNTTDRFSVSNPSARLTYKVGLMSNPEMNILNISSIRLTGQSYWTSSPWHTDSGQPQVRHVCTDGTFNCSSLVMNLFGVRPAVSLVSGIEFTDGDGTMASPYIVNTGA